MSIYDLIVIAVLVMGCNIVWIFIYMSYQFRQEKKVRALTAALDWGPPEKEKSSENPTESNNSNEEEIPEKENMQQEQSVPVGWKTDSGEAFIVLNSTNPDPFVNVPLDKVIMKDHEPIRRVD